VLVGGELLVSLYSYYHRCQVMMILLILTNKSVCRIYQDNIVDACNIMCLLSCSMKYRTKFHSLLNTSIIIVIIIRYAVIQKIFVINTNFWIQIVGAIMDIFQNLIIAWCEME